MNERQADQPAARVLGAFAAAARRGASSAATRGRRPTGSPGTSRSARGMMAVAVRHPGHDGPRYALRGRRPSSPSLNASWWRMVGDGAMQMNGNNVLITGFEVLEGVEGPAVRGPGAQQRRSEPGHLGAAGDERRSEAGGVAGLCRTSRMRPTPSRWDCRGIRIDRPEQIAPAWDKAFRSDRPGGHRGGDGSRRYRPLPPHITFKQAKAFTSALLRGDPDWPGIVRQTYRDMIESWVPHKG